MVGRHNRGMSDDVPPLEDGSVPVEFSPDLIESSIQRVLDTGLPLGFNFEYRGSRAGAEAQIRRWAPTAHHPYITATWRYYRIYEKEYVYDSDMDLFRTDDATFCINLRLVRTEQN